MKACRSHPQIGWKTCAEGLVQSSPCRASSFVCPDGFANQGLSMRVRVHGTGIHLTTMFSDVYNIFFLISPSLSPPQTKFFTMWQLQFHLLQPEMSNILTGLSCRLRKEVRMLRMLLSPKEGFNDFFFFLRKKRKNKKKEKKKGFCKTDKTDQLVGQKKTKKKKV